MPSDPSGSRATPDDELPAGVVDVQVLDVDGKPAPDVAISLSALRRSAEGSKPERLQAKTDATGKHRFEGLTTGQSAVYRLTASRGTATYAANPFRLDGRRGVRAVMRVYETTSHLEQARIGIQTALMLEIEQDAIVVQQLLTVINSGRTAFVPRDLTLPLPEGHRAFSAGESMAGPKAQQRPGGQLQLVGTFPPGRSELSYRYQIPLAGDAEQTIRVPLPPRVVHTRVMIADGSGVELAVSEERAYPPARPVRTDRGGQMLVSEMQPGATAGTAALEISLGGLPTRGAGRWIALAMALAVVAMGGGVAWRSRRARRRDARTELLVAAREALAAELATLEDAHRNEQLTEQRYRAVRTSLLEALGQVVHQMADAAGERSGETPADDEPTDDEPTDDEQRKEE